MELEGIQDRYVQVLRSYLEHAAPHHPGRLQELFARIPEVTIIEINPQYFCLSIICLLYWCSSFLVTDTSSSQFTTRKQNVLRTFRIKFCWDQIVYGATRRLVLNVLAPFDVAITTGQPARAPPSFFMWITHNIPSCVQIRSTRNPAQELVQRLFLYVDCDLTLDA